MPPGSQNKLPSGFFERLVFKDEYEMLSRLQATGQATLATPSKEERRNLLVHEVMSRLPELLDQVTKDKHASEEASAELLLISRLLREARNEEEAESQVPVEPLQLLRSIHPPNTIPNYPETGLKQPWLFTSARREPSLLNEFRAELAAVDKVDILVSFITWSGVRKLLDVLKLATALDANGKPRTRFRILTTTYIGATEARAVDALATLPGVEVRISLDGRRNRLHAKAWIFNRLTGFGSAYVGSANLSESALVNGIEWTVKFTEARDLALFEAARANFETLWNDAEFQRYDPADEDHKKALAVALQEQRGRSSKMESVSEPITLHTWFELRPKYYQQEMLDRLVSERRHGRTRNLVVAATGTGKTVVAAFDYQRLTQLEGSPPKILFIAHRVQILKQALATYRQVLRDPSFGDLLDGENEPSQYSHLFATITTVHRRELVSKLGGDFWRVVVIDEAHHLPASTFDQFVTDVNPSILLGLTATPERADGKSLNSYFDSRPDGSPAVSLRLWDALEQQLLAPFEYYATADETDLSQIKWNRMEEVSQLDSLVSSNIVRARLVTNSLQQYVANLDSLKAVAFCVSVKHAEFMADWFSKAGLPSRSLTGANTTAERVEAIQALRAGKLKIICTCDLFNEGVDIPEINTLLLLRPTQSPVVFQQQVGRGLRLHESKENCLVLDFIGLHSEEFRFDTLFRGITGQTRAQLKDSVARGFGTLPSGCHIQFDRVTRERVLGNLQRALQLNAKRLRSELAAWAAQRGSKGVNLKDFLRENEIDIADLYSNSRCWTSYKRDINLPAAMPGPREDELMRRMGSILHASDPAALNAWATVLSTGNGDATRTQMLAYQLLHKSTDIMGPFEFSRMIEDHPALRDELLEIVDWLQENSDLDEIPVPGLPQDWPLTLHARYERREIQSAVGHLTADSRPQFREGCLPLPAHKIELLFVTLDKREGFGDRVQYHDYAISPGLFHWQSQNMASAKNSTGKRYLESPTNGWSFQLFIRESTEHAFYALGPVTLLEHQGDRPISVTWKLEVPMPAEMFRRFSVLREV